MADLCRRAASGAHGRRLCPTAGERGAGGGRTRLSLCLCVFVGGASAAFINIVFLFSLSLIISLTFPHLPCDNSRGG